ncbi:MAG: hypothetical protein GAK35_00850 [Herbaspirillum frisingense]|uniref:Uncharacterized protein n=1 Tax=Herbaspirillum frisingense TaxID=92645 RepID=A0A7V8FZ56_9BURK|nr:MAG: hypothetical protein GAK35_00850 [Herbaspirillum frisingense]
MQLEHLLARAEALAYRISSELNGQPLPDDPRACAAIGCLTVAQQHHSAIIILLRNDMPVHASAFALIRHQIETAFNALWLWYCASDEEVVRFLQDGSGKTVRQLVAQVDGVLAGSEGAEAAIIRGHWSQLSDFVFSGERRIRHWLDANEVDAIYSEEAVAELADLANSIAELGLASYRNMSGTAGNGVIPQPARSEAVK